MAGSWLCAGLAAGCVIWSVFSIPQSDTVHCHRNRPSPHVILVSGINGHIYPSLDVLVVLFYVLRASHHTVH